MKKNGIIFLFSTLTILFGLSFLSTFIIFNDIKNEELEGVAENTQIGTEDKLLSNPSQGNDEKSNEIIKSEDEVKKLKEIVKTKPCKYNDIGEGVLEIQKMLNKFGYKIKEDGHYGDDTYFAVCNFQSKVGLESDGIVGSATIERLSLTSTMTFMFKPDEVAATSASIGECEEEKFINSQNLSSETDYFIWTDTVKCKVNIFTGSKNSWKLLKSIKCSVGATDTPTIKGTFSIASRGLMFRVNNRIICKYFTQFNEDYLFHSVLLDNNGKVVDGRLGVKISHGCVRLAVDDAKYIYENIPSSTGVLVK